MNKADLNRLEKVFASEIAGLPLFQSRSKHYERLEQEGYVERVTVTLGGRFPVRLDGWQLTIAGHYTYCNSCDYAELPEDIE